MTANNRLISLDAFRGFTIAAMIMVNNPGSWDHVYPPLLHKDWHGITPTDLIFPFFIFIVGVSIALAYSKQLMKGVPKKTMYKKIVYRSLKIFIIGILLWLFPKFDFNHVRYAGVLQRIAVVFLVSAIIFLNSKWKTQVVISVVILIGYWMAMVLIPTPGYGKAMLEPGVNLAAWFDSTYLPGVMWQKTWDPEGYLSTLPSIVTGISGILAGHLILSKLPQEKKVIYMFSFGFFAFATGYMWNYVFPINKNIWTSSFVMVTSGLAAMVLAISIFFVDMMKRTRLTKPGIIFGSNAIAVYVLSDVWEQFFYKINYGANTLSGYFMNMFETAGWSLKFGSFLYSVLFICFNFIPAWILYRKKIFIKL